MYLFFQSARLVSRKLRTYTLRRSSIILRIALAHACVRACMHLYQLDISSSFRVFKRHLDHPKSNLSLYPNMTPVDESQYQRREYLLVTTRCKNNPALAELKLMQEYSTWFSSKMASTGRPQCHHHNHQIEILNTETGNRTQDIRCLKAAS